MTLKMMTKQFMNMNMMTKNKMNMSRKPLP